MENRFEGILLSSDSQREASPPAMAEPRLQKWDGEVHAVIAAPVDKAWKIASDSCSLPKWMPMVETCEILEGEDGKPGCIRRLTGEMFPHLDGEKSWIRERLLVTDPSKHLYTYIMQDGNVGMSGMCGYVNTVQFFDFGEGTTLVQWLFEVDAVHGNSQEATMDYLTHLYKSAIKRLERVTLSRPGEVPASSLDSLELELGLELEREQLVHAA